MKTIASVFIALTLAAAPLAALPLMETTAIHAQPDATSVAIGLLKAGTDPIPAPNATAPAGWLAVEVPGPHVVYVKNSDFSKSLEIHVGAPMRQLPKAEAPVVANMQEGDKVEITGLRSGWTQISLSKTLVGYIRAGGPVQPAPVATPATPAPSPAAAPAGIPAPAPALATPPPAASNPAGISRLYQGMLVPTKRTLVVGPRKEFPYELLNPEGKRIAFIDVSRISAAKKIEPYIDSLVTITGVLKHTDDWKNLVIEVDTIEPK